MTHTQLLEIGLKKRNKQIDTSWQELADIHSNGMFVTGEAFRCWVKTQLRSKGVNLKTTVENQAIKDVSGLPNYKEETEIHKDGSQSSNKLLHMSVDDSKNVDFLLKAHGYCTKSWELISAKNNIWNSYSKKDGIMTLYSSKISVKPRVNSLSIDDIKELFGEMNREYQSPIHTPIRYNVNGKMLEVNIADLHLAKLSWSGDSNDTYNHEIARERFFYIINDVLTRTKGQTFDKILFVYSNDFFHHDGTNATTTGGTRMDTDLKWTQMFKVGVQMLVEAIDMLSQVAPVSTLYIASNHDQAVSYYAIEYLHAWYRNNPNVTVNNDPKSRKYIEFGKCLVGFAHGHRENKRLSSLMPIEAKDAWSRTSFREFHLGHIHSEKMTTEENGIIIRHISSPTGTDQWHYESGYVGAIQKSQSFIWDRENGLETIINTTIK